MSITMEYIARRVFRYDNRQYQPGDVWEPAGGKFDRQIIDNDFVTMREVETPIAKGKGKSNGTEK